MDGDRFWTLVELAWAEAECRAEGPLRSRILGRRIPDVDGAMAPFFAALSRVLATELTRQGLVEFVAELDRAVLSLKTSALADYLGARDLAFLAARYRTVALGERHYRAVFAQAKSALAVEDADRIIVAVLWPMYDMRFAEWRAPAALRRCRPARKFVGRATQTSV